MDEEAHEQLERLVTLDSDNSDPEAAHSAEDALLWMLVDDVLEGNFDEATELALALKDHDRKYPDRVRWCA